MSAPAYKKLRELQKALYDRAYADAHAVVVGTSKSIISYSKKFEASLPEQFKGSSLQATTANIHQNNVVLYGDFHTLRQSQRGFLRLLRSYIEQYRTGKIVIALEMFKARDQRVLNQFIAGEISESVFKAAISYEVDWGFPWQNFKMIIDFAKNLGLPIIGINSTNAGRDSLAVRDRYSAKIIANTLRRHPDHKIFCMIGEYHLADSHLPTALWRELNRQELPAKLTRVVNNVDRFYFSLGEPTIEGATEYLQLKKDFYCIMNTPPWLKWQSFSIWEELRNVQSYHKERAQLQLASDDRFMEESFDVDYQFYSFVKTIAEFLGLKLDNSDLESFNIYYCDKGSFLDDVSYQRGLSVSEVNRVLHRVRRDSVYYISSTNAVLLTKININNLAEAAGQYLHRLLAGPQKDLATTAEAFYQRVVREAVGIVASKIMNPRRKTLPSRFYLQYIKRNHRRRLSGEADVQRQIARAIIKHEKWISRNYSRVRPKVRRSLQSLPKLDILLNLELSRALGQSLGTDYYQQIISSAVPTSELRKLFEITVTTPADTWKLGDLLFQRRASKKIAS